MKIKLSIFVAFVALFIVLANSSASYAQDGQITGGYGDADVNDAEVIKTAKFAIKKGSKKEKAKVTLLSIKKARIQIVAGLNYEICLEIDVKKSGKQAVKQYIKTVVYRNLKNVYSLTSWTVLKDLAECEDS